MSEYIEKFGGLSDTDWLATLKSSICNSVIDGISFPGFPDPTIQSNWVGSANEMALDDAFNFYINIKSYCENLGMPLRLDSKILDFGVGWGRILRFFLKDTSISNLYGIDVDPVILKICEQTKVPGSLRQVGPSGPTDFNSESFDLIYAYSVFSHLSETTHIEWIKEFTRILKPGGIFIATTWPRSFIDFCISLKENGPDFHPHHPVLNDWFSALARAFPEPNLAFSAYDSGEYLFVSTQKNVSFYGDTLIPKGYIEKNWIKYLNLCQFIDDKSICPQAMIVMKKEPTGSKANLLIHVINFIRSINRYHRDE